jgi:hypothetical protein
MSAQTTLNAAIAAGFDRLSDRDLIMCILRGASSGGASQIYTSTYADPNAAGLIPGNPQLGAIYNQDPSITPYNSWSWSVVNQAWVQVSAP